MTRRSHGTGLGLFLVDQIIQRHGGTVDIRTQTSGETGTMFIVSFPAKETP
jgi:signal transduction histidine kinase